MTYPILNFDDAERCFYSFLDEGQFSLELFKVKQSNRLNLNFNDRIISDLWNLLKFENLKNLGKLIKTFLLNSFNFNINSKISEDQDFWSSFIF